MGKARQYWEVSIMNWDYGEDRVRSVATRMQDDGYGEEFARYFRCLFTDTVVIKYL